MKLDLDHLMTFRSVVRCGTFSGAAASLHYAQSTVSVHIRQLESELGVRLFDRLPVGVRLTDAGQRLLPIADRMIDLAAAAASVAEPIGDAVGEVRIAAPETVVAHALPPVLRELRDRQPGVRVRLEGVRYHEIGSAVSSGSVDLGFLLQPPVASTSTLEVRQLRREPLLMVAAPDHPLARPVGDAADEFARSTLLLTEHGCGYRPLFEAHLARAGVRPGHTIELDSVEAIRRYVEAGLGVALLPGTWIGDALNAGSLVQMSWFAPTFHVAVQLAWHPSRWLGPALSAVIDASQRLIGGEASAGRSRRGPSTGSAGT